MSSAQSSCSGRGGQGAPLRKGTGTGARGSAAALPRPWGRPPRLSVSGPCQDRLCGWSGREGRIRHLPVSLGPCEDVTLVQASL